MHVIPRSFCTAAFLFFAVHGFAQGTRADYERALNLPKLVANKVTKARVEPHWLAGGEAFWYRNDLGDGRREFILVSAQTGERRPAFDHAKLADALTQALGRPIDAERLPIQSIYPDPDGANVRFRIQGDTWSYSPASAALARTPDGLPAETIKPDTAPRRSRAGGDETTLTFVNHTAGEIECIWISPEGTRKRYATVKAGETFEQHTYAGHVWLVQNKDGKLLGVFEAAEGRGDAVVEPTPAAPAPKQEAPSQPASARVAEWEPFIRDNNVFCKKRGSTDTVQLSHDGTADDSYQGPLLVSPDGTRLAALQVRKGDDRKIHLIESSPKDQLEPKLLEVSYAKPGDRVRQERPRLFDLQTGRQIPVSEDLFSNPWDVSQLRWAPDSSCVQFLFNQRGHQVLRVLAIEAATGTVRPIVEERSATFIDYSQKTFLKWLDDTGELLWMSERDGWNHLWLYDARTGAVKNQVTRGPWVVREVERVDTAKRQIWFRACGILPGQDPYYIHLARVNFDGSGLTVLTEGNGTHKWQFSPDSKYFVDTWSRVDQPPVSELRRADTGTRVCLLENADSNALLGTGWRPAQRFAAKGRDGVTDIYGTIVRPSNFDPAKKYPVIENIYAGPHGAFVRKEWSSEVAHHALAELGFIVVQIDGMGTNWRSRAFHDVCWKNLSDAGFPDRIAWMRAAAAQCPELDLSRVGIYGGSAGGQNALAALLFHGDFYKVGAADCGCHDNRMDKIWWNEAWMGWPVGPEYAANSNVTHAKNLTGKLLLTVGELDHNVDPASTMQVVNALIKADRDFDLLVVPGSDHGAGESPYAARRRQDFFVRHLLGVEPRS